MRGAGLVCLGGFACLTVLVHLRLLEQADQSLMAATKVTSSEALDLVAGVLNYLGAGEITLIYALVLSAFLWRSGIASPAVAAPFLFLVSVPVEFALKFTVDQPVPSAELYRPTFRYLLAGLPTMQSYPSGHSIRMAFFLTVTIGLASLVRGRVAIGLAAALLPLVLLSGWTRSYLGHHWPLDVVGGWMLGAGLGLLAIAIVASARRRVRIAC